MAIKTRIEPNMMLFRWKDGKLSGVMKRDILRTIKDGVELKSQELDAEPVAEDDVPSCIPAADSVAMASRLFDVEKQQRDQIENLESERDRLAERVKLLESNDAKQIAQIQQMMNERQSLLQAIDHMQKGRAANVTVDES